MYCSPRHRMPSNSRNEGSKSVDEVAGNSISGTQVRPCQERARPFVETVVVRQPRGAERARGLVRRGA